MTPEQAQWRLAGAHKSMTAEEISTHALAMAGIIASLDQTCADLCTVLTTTIARANGGLDLLKKTDGLITEAAHSLVLGSGHRALEMMTGVQAILSPFEAVEPIPDLSQHPTIEVSWPDIFDPRGAASNG